MIKKKNILITGGAGFIGSNLAETLSKNGHNVVSIDDYSFGKKENEHDNVKYIKNDIEKISDVDESIDVCYHLAAKARVQPSFDDPVDYFRVNVKGTMKVMEWAKKK
ncbi:MAG: NAD-dependent epimerase/dehydratase family protein [Flavobacteriaceae bacterium]